MIEPPLPASRSSAVMRSLVLLTALAMPLVAWFAQRGAFGPDNSTISAQYPTLIVAAGYAFSIWGPIFLLAVVFGVWQCRSPARLDAAIATRAANAAHEAHAAEAVLRRIRPVAAAGFALTAAWMVVFPQQVFWLALLVIWLDLACFLWCAVILSDAVAPSGAASRGDATLARLRIFAWLPLSLQAGWLGLAAFLNLAQFIVARQWLPTDDMLPWSLVLLAAAAVLLLGFNHRMRGNLPFVFAGLWGLVAVWFRQTGSPLPGAPVAGWVALAIAGILAAQTVRLRLRC